MGKVVMELLTGELLEDDVEWSLAELCRASRLPAERVMEYVELGIIEPVGSSPGVWRFSGVCLNRIRTVRRLERDLQVNLAGAALVLDLLDEIDSLRARLRRLESE